MRSIHLAPRFGLILLVSAMTLMVAPAVAQDVKPSEITETYGAWRYRCQQMAEVDGKSCEVIQAVRDQKGAVVAQMAFGLADNDDELTVVFQVPQGTLLTEPIRLSAKDSERSIETSYLTCMQSVCLARNVLKRTELAFLETTEAIMLDLKERSGKPIRIVFPSDGIGSALKRLVSQ